MRLKGIKGIALLIAAVLLLVIPMAAIPAAAGEERHEEFRWDARYWWEALPLSPHYQQQVREIMVSVFDRYFETDISAMSPQKLEELWNAIDCESREKVLCLSAQYATTKGFQIPGMPTPREEFIPPAGATYWWEFVDPELREGAIVGAKEDIPEALRSVWELTEWKGVELPIPRPENLDVMRLTPEEYNLILTPSFPLGRIGVEEWINRYFPGVDIIATFGRTRAYSNPAKWFDRLREVTELTSPLFLPLMKSKSGIWTKGIDASGYISVWLDCRKLTRCEAVAIAPKIYAMIATKAEMVGVQDVPVVIVLRWIEVHLAGSKDPRGYLGTPLPLDQKFRPIPGGAQVKGRSWHATAGFPVQRPIVFWWDDKDLTTTGHLGGPPVPINTRVYQPTELGGNKVGTVAGVASRGGFADVARVATPDGNVIPYIRVMTFWTSPVTGSRDPALHEWSGKFGRTTGRTSGRILSVNRDTYNPAFGVLQDQVWTTIRVEPGDSGAPLFISAAGGGVAVTGIAWGFLYCPHIGRIGLFSPVSGVMTELPGWRPFTRR
ncbi:MAG: hypothetical protein DDT26_02467 [Dehalococcoidia bacterium]|nr:hypothetical protein [Chloroflexota bacterium]